MTLFPARTGEDVKWQGSDHGAEAASTLLHSRPLASHHAWFHMAHLGGLNTDARESQSFRRVKIIGCGSAYYSGQIGAQLIEELPRIPADAEPASEFRYRSPVVEADTLYIAIGQSGVWYDTLAAVRELKRNLPYRTI